MPPHIRATFMPNPPIKQLPPIKKRRRKKMSGVFELFDQFEKTPPPKRIEQPTAKVITEKKAEERTNVLKEKRKLMTDEYRALQRKCGGEYEGMNCYNTLFIGRLAYEVTERKLLREMEAFGPVKDIKLVCDKEGKSRGICFIEYENEEDMKRAYRAADGMKIEGREIVVDVERGHTVPTWLPRRLSGGFGGTRLGGKDQNILSHGRFDPTRIPPPHHDNAMMVDEMNSNRGGRGSSPPNGRYPNDGPPRNDRRRRRSRSRSPERGRYAPRSRY